jgi:hypothetical protein
MSKIKEEQLKTLVEQKTATDELIINLGMLEAKKHELLHTFAQISGELEDTKKDLEEEYGKINIDLQTGIFTRAEDEQDS